MAKHSSRKFKEDVEFQMAPMIDVVFQLLIFFFCVTTFAKIQSEEGILLATARSAETLKKDETSLVVNVRNDGVIKVNGEAVTVPALENFLKDLVEQKGSKSFEVIIRSDRKSKYGSTKDVFRACARAGCVFVKLGVEKPDDEKQRSFLLDPTTGEEITMEEFEEEFGDDEGPSF